MYDQVGYTMYDQVGYTMYDQAGYTMYDQVGYTMYDQAGYTMYDQVGYTMYDKAQGGDVTTMMGKNFIFKYNIYLKLFVCSTFSDNLHNQYTMIDNCV